MELDEEEQKVTVDTESLLVEPDDSVRLFLEEHCTEELSGRDLLNSNMCDMDIEHSHVDVDDDIITLNLPPASIERSATENFADSLLMQLDAQEAQEASFVSERDGAVLNDICSGPLDSVRPLPCRLGTEATMLQFSVDVKTGQQSAYTFKNGILFTKMNSDVYFTVHCPTIPPSKSYIKIFAAYTEEIYANVSVRRCATHRERDREREEHFIVVKDNDMAQYVTESNDGVEGPRWFVILPFYDLPQDNSITLQFRCYSSCFGGINKRPVMLCFRLENDDRLIGYSEVMLKVCSCPIRDAKAEARGVARGKRLAARHAPPFAEAISVSTKKASQNSWEDDDTIYDLEIRGKHLYKIICSIVRSFELSRRYLEDENQASSRLRVRNESPTLTANTSVESWLDGLNLLKYLHLFSARALYVMGDLQGVIDKKYLHLLGIAERDATKMLSSYLSWFNVFNADRLSSLSSEPSTVRVRRTRISNSFRTSDAN